MTVTSGRAAQQLFLQRSAGLLMVGVVLILTFILWASRRIYFVRNAHEDFYYTDAASFYGGNVNTDLVVYVYYEAPDQHENLLYFLRHGLHDKADFVFIMNGEYADDIRIPKRSNIRVLNRPNTCMDFGAWPIGIKFAEMRRKPYERYILMNASVRGPMMPAWSKSCWSDIFFNRLNRNNVKLVGLTYNCQFKPHVQSMLIALDRVSLQIVQPTLKCYQNIEKAIWEGELVLADMIRHEGYNVDVVMSAFQGVKNYQEICEGIGPHNPWHTNAYFNRSFHPFETIFHKSNRHVDDHALAMYTKWAADRKYSSYDYCKRGK